jgi:hypothetical protein
MKLGRALAPIRWDRKPDADLADIGQEADPAIHEAHSVNHQLVCIRGKSPETLIAAINLDDPNRQARRLSPPRANMARREQYATALKCDRCGTTGSASFEQNDRDDSNQGDLGRELLSIEGKFRAEADDLLRCPRLVHI